MSRNRFNLLSSKEWLPFQKSWFRFQNDWALYSENVRFFTKGDSEIAPLYYQGHDEGTFREFSRIEGLKLSAYIEGDIQFALLDLRQRVGEIRNFEELRTLKQELLNTCASLAECLLKGRFLSVIVPNVQFDGQYYPFAWDLGKSIGQIFSLKDEKIACLSSRDNELQGQGIFYVLYFRLDDQSELQSPDADLLFKTENPFHELDIPDWFILKPPPRKRAEILHPAKYPEELVQLFVSKLTAEGDNVFDPMSGTGSSQLGAIRLSRNAFGTELSPFFAEIARHRCSLLIDDLFLSKPQFRIEVMDARNALNSDFPPFDYIITSPPYWDMLNMKGAENQAKRKEKGLQTNYSDDSDDLGNINDYQEFIKELAQIYLNLSVNLKKGGYLSIVVKNIKKKGRNYPFAWDLMYLLQDDFDVLPEKFWCQDDIRLAPYGYGYTWVSNTFHQYCLSFRKK
jgi:DNA modification methylase